MRIIKRLVIFTFFLVIGTTAKAGTPPPPPTTTGTTDPSCWPPPCVPVDGGISLLIAAGAVYGAKKLYEKRKKPARPH